MFHAEVVRRDGTPVGYVRAASYGYTLGGAVGLAMVEAGEPINAGVPVVRNVGGRDRRHAATRAVVSMRPLYDPDNTRIRS